MKAKKINQNELAIGTPLEPMLVLELESENRYADVISAHGGCTLAEVKSDGNRIQVHKAKDKIWLFTRNLNEMSPEQFPELNQVLQQLPPGIYDGEIVGVEDGIKGFKAIQKRKNARVDSELVRQYPLQIRFFDILRNEYQTLTNLSLTERRAVLEAITQSTSRQWKIGSEEELQSKYDEVIDTGLEGLVCKDAQSAYKIGKRTKDWIKLKEFITLDLAILGVYQGEGKAAQLPFAALLLGARNNGNYESLVKVGISNKELIAEIDKRIKPGYVNAPPAEITMSPALQKAQYARKVPMHYVQPNMTAVVEVSTMNVTYSANWHSCGLADGKAYSLRIPIVQRLRDDKNPADSATTEDISRIYNSKAQRE